MNVSKKSSFHRTFLAVLFAVVTYAGVFPSLQADATGSGASGSLLVNDFESEMPWRLNATFNTPGEFRFITPIAPNPHDAMADFDGSLLSYLTVSVCRVAGTECLPVRTFNSSSSSSERLRIESKSSLGSYYIVNWDASRIVDNTSIYRITVDAAGIELGTVDLGPSLYKPFGRTWPIKFIIEKDAALRIQVLAASGTSIWEVADNLRSELGICGDDLSELLSTYPNATAEEIEMVVNGVCQIVEIPNTTKIADAATRDALSFYDAATGRMWFAAETSLLKQLNVNDVLVSKPSEAAPHGYLRKVISIRKDKGMYIVDTVQAKIYEAITRGTLQIGGTLLPSGGASIAREPASSSAKGGAITASLDEGDQLTVDQPIDVTFNLEEEDGDVSGTGTIRVTGHVFIKAGYNIGAGIEPCVGLPPVCVDRLEAWMGFEQKSNLRVVGTFKGEVKKEETIYPVPMQPIIFFIGPIPVVLVPQMSVIVGVEGKAQIDFEFAAVSDVTMKPYIKWTEDEGWKDLSTIDDPLEKTFLDADITGTIEAEAYAKLDAAILLYGVVGPSMDGSLGIGGKAQFGASPLWQVFGHAEVGIGLRSSITELFGVDSPREAILDETFLIKEAENQAPVFSNVRTGLIPVDVNSPVYLGPRSSPTSLQGYYEVRDPEGTPFDRTVTLNGQTIADTVTFATPGLRTIKVTATDSDGESASIFLAIDVRNSIPILTVTPPSGEIAAGDQFILTARAYDPEDGFLPCSRISWNVVAPDVRQVSSSTSSCKASVIFNVQGVRQVKVRATDSFGVAFEHVVNVNVGPPPANRKPVIDIDSFKVYAFRGPRSDECAIGLFCEAPDNSLLSNGEPGSGEYDPPLYMEMNVTDPEGDPFIVQWFCQTGDQFAPITYTEDGYPSCEPLYSANDPIRVYAAIMTPGGLGGDGSIVLGYSPEYQYVMLQRTQ